MHVEEEMIEGLIPGRWAVKVRCAEDYTAAIFGD
jgi:hypothetical protein